MGDILPPGGSSSVAVIDCSTDNPTQPLTWTDGAGQPVPTSPNLTVYQTTNGSSAALHIDTTDTSTFTNGRYQCDGGMERVVNIYINREGGESAWTIVCCYWICTSHIIYPITHIATIELVDLQGVDRADAPTTAIVLTQATAERSERYISSFERKDLKVPLEVEFEETESSGTDGDTIDRSVFAPGAEYTIQIWSINGSYFSKLPLITFSTLVFDTGS